MTITSEKSAVPEHGVRHAAGQDDVAGGER